MASQPFIIIGGGGHTRVLIGVLQANGAAVHGVLTQDESLLGTQILGVPVLGLEGADGVLPSPDQACIANGVGNRASRKGSGLAVREGLYARYTEMGYDIPMIWSLNANVMAHVNVSIGAQIMAGAQIQPGSWIAENAIVNSCASIDHDCMVGKHAHIAPGAILCGNVKVGARTHVGAGAVVSQGVVIGDDCVIGAGAVVTRNVVSGQIVLPAQSTVTAPISD